MKHDHEDAEQSSKQNQDGGRSEGVNPNTLQPVEERLWQYNYPSHVIENYPKLVQNDLHLAEIYRLGATGTPDLAGDKKKLLNPVQTKVDGKGRIWVDVLIRKKEEIKTRELKRILKIQGKPGRGHFFSGRILVDDLPELKKMADIVHTARPIAPFLDISVPLIKADRKNLTQRFPIAAGQRQIDGSGVIVGIVDTVIDFAHPNFVIETQNGNQTIKKSRFLCIWNQTGKGKPPKGYKDGVEYSHEKLNDALNGKIDLKYVSEGITEEDRHGTHVTDIAAGRSSDPDFLGVAPGADIIYVHLGKPTGDDPKAKANDELKSLGSSEFLYNAVKYIFEKADELNQPAVVNLSLGAYGGSHDGTSILEQKFDELLNEKPGRAIVIAAGNGLQEEIHTSGTVVQGAKPYIIKWYIPSLENRIKDFRQELEIWYDKNSALKVEVIPPETNTSLGISQLGDPALSSEILADTQTPRWVIYHTKPDPAPGEDENHIDILVDDRKRQSDNMPQDIKIKGTWQIKLTQDPSRGSSKDIKFHAWIERNTNCQSKFRSNSKKKYTLNSIANAELPIVVGSFDFHRSSSGPSRNKKNKKKPELNAPGQDIFAARAGHNGNTQLSGTSMSAPHVTGVIALMFQAAKERRNPSKILSIDEIRKILLNSVFKNTPNKGHNRILGFGRVNAVEAIEQAITNQ